MPAEVALAVAADDGGANVPVYDTGTAPAAGALNGLGYLAGTKQLVFGHNNDVTAYGIDDTYNSTDLTPAQAGKGFFKWTDNDAVVYCDGESFITLSSVAELPSLTLAELNTLVSDEDVSRATPLTTNYAWVNPFFGDDDTAQAGNPNKPYKYIVDATDLKGAYVNTPARGTIYLPRGAGVPTGNTGTLPFLMDKAINIIGGPGNNGGCTIRRPIIVRLDNTDSYISCFVGLLLQSTNPSYPAVLIDSCTTHEIRFIECYFYGKTPTETEEVLKLTGSWAAASGTSNPRVVRLNNCSILGTITMSAGTPGSPFLGDGVLQIESSDRVSAARIVQNSGMVKIMGNSMTPHCTLNGGCLEITDHKFLLKTEVTDLNGYSIVCNNVASAGISFLFLRNSSQNGYITNPSIEPSKIKIGAYVVYHVDSDAAKYANIEIDPLAINYADYLVSIGQVALLAYQSNMLFLAKGLCLPATRQGTATLVGGTVTIANTSITANSRIHLTRSTTGGTVGHLSYTQVNGTSFTITSSSNTDTSTINYLITESV